MQHIPGDYREDKKSFVESVVADHVNLSLRTAIAPAERVAYRFDALLVVLTQRGEIRCSTDVSPQQIHHRRDDILLVPRDAPVYTDYLQPTGTQPLTCITLEIDDETIMAVRGRSPAHWPDSEDYAPLYALDDIDAFMHADAAAAIRRLDRLLRGSGTVARRDLLIDTISRELVLYVMQSSARAALRSKAPPSSRLGDLARYIEDHLDGTLDAVTLARHCHMSRSAFHEHFVATFGQTPAAFVRERRIERARYLLCHVPEASLTAVAAQCGFASVSHFVQTFRRSTGIAPAAFRREARQRRAGMSGLSGAMS